MQAMREPPFQSRWMVRCAAIAVHMLAILLLTVSPSAAQDERHTAAAAAGEPARAMTAGSRCRRASAQRSSPTTSATRGTWSSPRTVWSTSTPGAARYYDNDTPPAGGFLVALQDTTGDGHADVVARFGPAPRAATPAEPGSRCIMARSTRRRTTASCATPCRRA